MITSVLTINLKNKEMFMQGSIHFFFYISDDFISKLSLKSSFFKYFAKHIASFRFGLFIGIHFQNNQRSSKDAKYKISAKYFINFINC